MDNLGIEPLDSGDSLGIEPLGIEPLETQSTMAGKGASSIPGAEGQDQLDIARRMGPPSSAMGGVQLLPRGALEAAANAPTDILRGGAATALNTLTGGLIAPAAGFIQQFGGKQTGPEAAGNVAEALSYNPSSEGAQTVAENFGKVLEPLAALGPMNLHAPGFMRMSKAERIKREASSTEKAKALDEHLAKTEPLNVEPLNVEPLTGQGDLFGFQNTEGMASQFEPNRAQEPVEPLRQRRQMELPLGEPGAGPMTATPDGVLNHPANAELFKARDMREEVLRQQLDAEQRARAPGELFPEDPYQGKLGDQGPQLPEQSPAAQRGGMLSEGRRQPGLDFGPEAAMQVTPEGQVLRGAEDANTNFAIQQQRAVVEAAQRAVEQEALGSRARAEAVQRAKDAQEQLRLRQVELEQAVKKQTLLDQNAAERARQQAAPQMSEANRQFIAQQEQARLAAESNKMQNMHQMEIDPTPHAGPGEIYGAQFGTHEGMGRVDEHGMPIRADLSMEAQNLQNPLQRNLWGDELGPSAGQQRSLTGALDSLKHTPFKGDARDAALAALGDPKAITNMYTFGHHMIDEGLRKLGLTLVKNGAEYTARDGNGKTVGRLTSNMTGEQNKQLRAMGEKIPANVDIVKVSDEYKGKGVGSALYQAWAADHEGNIAPHGNTTQAAWDLWKRNFPEQVDKFVQEQAARLQDGTPLRQVMDQVKDPIIADRIRAEAYEPGKPIGLYKKQGGFIKMPFGKSEPVKAALEDGPLGEKLKALVSDRRTPEEVIPVFAKLPDIAQNQAQKFFNGLTKGAIYLNDRLKNPLFKYVTDQFKEADNRAKSQINMYIHDMLGPALRALNDADLAEAWTAIDKMDKANRRLSDEQLDHLGYSKEARRAIQTHFEVMDAMVPKINAAMDAAGLSHIDPRAAYAAAKTAGTFRKVLLNADGEVVAALGAKTERDLRRQVAAAKEHLGEDVTEGPTHTMGRNPRPGDISDILSFLSSQDPKIAEFLKNSQEALAPNVRGAKTHFMAKKGVIGMEGRKPWESDYVNAKEGFEAQIKYVQRMLEFAEKAKAEAATRPVLNAAEINQPVAKRLAQQYADFEMGKNTYGAAKAADAIQEFFNTAAGGNVAWVGDVARGARKVTNLTLLSLNPGFLAANVLQPIRNVPELAQYVGGDFGTGSFAKVLSHMASEQVGIDSWSPLMKDAMKYAEDNHIYSSDLLDRRTGIRGFGQGEGAGHKIGNSLDAMDHWLQKPASTVENFTRQSFFLTMVDVLDRKGVTPKDGLFDIAANLTDRGMNRYSMSEAPGVFKGMGALGGAPYNLMSYKFNELSRIASFMRDAKETGNIAPLATSLAMQVSFAGIMGTIGYQEADWLVRQFSEMAGKPTSLTKILLDNADKKIVGPVQVKHLAYGGLSSATGVDFSNRMGIGSILGSSDPLDMLAPGSSKLVEDAKAAYEYGKGVVKNPSGSANSYNAKVAAMNILPGGAMLEPHLFPESTDNKGNKIGFNWRKNEAGVERNSTDLVAKRLGMTGVAESMKKSKVYENKQMDKIYDEHLTSAIENLAKGFKETGKIDPAYIADFNKWKGDPNTLQQRITDIAQRQKIPMDVQDKLRALANGQTVPGANKVMRRFY